MKSRGVNGLYCTVIALLICCLKRHCIVVIEPCIVCTGDMCRLGVSIFGGRVKNLMF